MEVIMSRKSQIVCRECGREGAEIRCANCGYAVCTSCGRRLGGGAIRMPKCPMCGSRSWKSA